MLEMFTVPLKYAFKTMPRGERGGRPVSCNVKRFHNTAVWDSWNIRLHVLDKL